MDVRMPDGTVIKNVPDNVTQEDLLAQYGQFQQKADQKESFLDKASKLFSLGPKELSPDQQEISDRMSGDLATDLSRSMASSGEKTVGKFTAEHYPEIGATIASLAVPPLAAPAWAARAGLAGRMAIPLITNAPKVAAAAAGGGLGGAAREATLAENPTPASVAGSAAQGAKDMAIAETVGVGVGSLIGKALKPFGGMTDDVAKLREFAKQNDIPISPSSFNPSAVSKAIDGGTDAFAPSRLAKDYIYRRHMVTRFNQLASELPKEVGEVRGIQETNKMTMNALNDLFKASEQAGKGAAKAFLENVGKDTTVSLKSTIPVLKQIQKSSIDDDLINYASKKLSLAKAGKMTAEELETAMRQVSGIKPKADKKFLEQIRNAIKSDFEGSGADMSILTESNKAFKEDIGLLASGTARQIKRAVNLGMEPPAITVKIFRSGNEQFVEKLGEKLPKEVWDDLRAQNIASMIENSSVPSQRLFGMKILDGNKLAKILNSNKTVLEAAYKDRPETLGAVRNLAELAKHAAGDFSKYEKGLGVAEGAGTLALGGLGYLEPTSLVVGTGTSLALSKSMMNPRGIMNTWLTSGFKTPTPFKEAVKFGFREAFDKGQ